MPSATPLTVMTWNIGRVHLGVRLNRVLRHDSRADDRALHHVARVLGDLGPEVVVLQELTSRAQLDALHALLGDEWGAHMGPEGEPHERTSDRTVGLLVHGRGRDARHETLRFAEGRAAEVARGPGWCAVGVHFDAFRAAVRRRQAEELLAFVDSRDEETVIVAGDMNIDLRYPLHAKKADRAFMRALTASFTDLGRGKGPTVMGRRRLDYVLVRGAEAAEARVVRRKRVPLGDHDPVLARITLTARAATRISVAEGARRAR